MVFKELYLPITEIGKDHSSSESTRLPDGFGQTLLALCRDLPQTQLRFALAQMAVVFGSDYLDISVTKFGFRTVAEFCQFFLDRWREWKHTSLSLGGTKGLACVKLLNGMANKKRISARTALSLREPFTKAVCALMHPKVWDAKSRNIVHLRADESDEFGFVKDLCTGEWSFLGDSGLTQGGEELTGIFDRMKNGFWNAELNEPIESETESKQEVCEVAESESRTQQLDFSLSAAHLKRTQVKLPDYDSLNVKRVRSKRKLSECYSDSTHTLRSTNKDRSNSRAK